MQNKNLKEKNRPKMATKEELKKLREDGLKRLKKPCNYEVFVRLRDR